MAAATTAPDASNEKLESIVTKVANAALAPVVAKIGSVEADMKQAAKPKPILRKTITGTMKATPMIGAMMATKGTTCVSFKAASTKIKATAVSVSNSKRTAARNDDVFEEARIPKKTKFVDEEETEDEEKEE